MTSQQKNFTPEQLLQVVKEQSVNFIDLQFTDVGGAVKNVTIPTQELKATLNHGIWFDGSSIEGFARIAESDMYLIPDTSTFAVLPWLSGNETTARLICDVYTPDRQPFLGDPRAVLKRVLAEAEKMGFIYNTGPELNFSFLNHPRMVNWSRLTPRTAPATSTSPSTWLPRACGGRSQMVSRLLV